MYYFIQGNPLVSDEQVLVVVKNKHEDKNEYGIAMMTVISLIITI